MNKSRATVIAFLAAPLVAAVAFAEANPESLGFNPISALAFVPIWYFYAMLFTLAFGLPSYLALERLRIVRWWSTAAMGLVLGCLVMGLAQGFGSVSARQLCYGGTIGLAESIAFWALWRRGRADIDDKRR